MLPMTLGCTLCGFLTHETPCTPLSVPADYPDPCCGCGLLKGMGIGHHKVTRGLPMPITVTDGQGLRGVTVFWGMGGMRGIGPVSILWFPFLLFSNWHGKVWMLKECIHGTWGIFE